MTAEINKSTKQEIGIPAKFVKAQTINERQSGIITIDKQRIILPFEFLQYEATTKGYRGQLPSNKLLPGIKSFHLKVNSNLLITIFPKKKRPKEVKHV